MPSSRSRWRKRVPGGACWIAIAAAVGCAPRSLPPAQAPDVVSGPRAQPEPEPAPEPAPEPEPEPAPEPEPDAEPEPASASGIRWLDEANDPGAPAVDPEVLRRVLPKEAREMLDEDPPHLEFWARLDPDGRRYLTHVRWGAVESTLIVVDGSGKVVATSTQRDRVPRVGLADVLGDEQAEIVVETIEGTALSAYPAVLKFHRLLASGKLVVVATVADSYGYGSKCVAYYFQNEVTVPAKGTIRVQNRYFDGRGENPPQNAPRHAGEAYELRWNEKRNRFDRAKLPPAEPGPGPEPCRPERPDFSFP